MQGNKQTKLAAFLSFTGEPWSCQLQYCSQVVNSVSVVSDNPLALLHTFQSIYDICSRAEATDLPPSIYRPSCSMAFERCSLFVPGVLSGGLTSPTFPLLDYSIYGYSSASHFRFLFLSCPVLKIARLHLAACLML